MKHIIEETEKFFVNILQALSLRRLANLRQTSISDNYREIPFWA